MMDASFLRRDFPQLRRSIRGKPIVYLDSTATSLKPTGVINKENDYYTRYTANIFRGIYTTSEEATKEYEDVRVKVAQFIHASKPEEIIFTRNTTESINLVAYSLIHGDDVVASIMEHHSNFVPWQRLGHLIVWDYKTDLEKIITGKTKLFAITAVSNVLGTIVPIKKIVRTVKRLNPKCLVLVDAAQAVPHMAVDVLDWGADFIAFSSHKMLGPTGVGVLWGKYELLSTMKPFMYGGEMIEEVHCDKTIFKAPPHRFEAGTPHIAGVIGLGAAVDYLTKLGMSAVRAHEKEITSYALKTLSSIKEITIVGATDPKERSGVISFTVKGVHPHDVAQVLDQDNVCIRVGFHCAQPLHEYLRTGPTCRASFYVYTTKEDIDVLTTGLQKVIHTFS
jgi:cysteine desulfurase/selenocysteine lyase